MPSGERADNFGDRVVGEQQRLSASGEHAEDLVKTVSGRGEGHGMAVRRKNGPIRGLLWRRMMRPKNPQSLVAGAALAALLSAAIGVVAQSTPSRSLLALSKRNHTLAIVDPNTDATPSQARRDSRAN